MKLNSNQIQKIIPHRYPFLLVDRILDYKPGSYGKGIKAVSANEPFFQGHFPEYHVMPGVLIVEALAQVGAVVILSTDEFKGKIAMFRSITNCKFKKQALPGDVLELEIQIDKIVGVLGVGKGRALINGEVCVLCELTFAIVDKEQG